MEDNLKILKVEYLSNPWSDLAQILNFELRLRGQNNNLMMVLMKKTSKGRQPPMKTTSNGRWPPMENGLKILKVKYLSNTWSDLTLILNLTLGDQNKIKTIWNEDNLQWKTTSIY